MADLSLKIAVKLLTKNFHQGVNTLKGSLRSLQMQFFALSSALGAGSIGFANLISRMRDTAKETAQVQVALKNVSGSTAAFVENQKWLLSVAKKYGVQINTLTSGFTKFKAAADIANMSADDQRKIFESVSRASVAYALSAEDQRGVFMALSQMMSKGKVMAEELRLQMAERLPVAIQAMAKAMGVSVNQMDAMMKQGKVLSSEVLPKFAEALTEMTPNIDLDNLNKSLSDLSNSFVRLTEAFDIEGKYKAIVDKLGGALSWLADHTKGVAMAMKGALALVFGKGVLQGFGLFVNEQKKATANALQLIKDEERARDNHVKKLQALDKAQTDYQIACDNQAALSAQASEKSKERAARNVATKKMALSKATTEFEIANNNLVNKSGLVTEKVRAQAAMQNAGMLAKSWNGVGIAIKRAFGALKAFAAATFWSAIIGAAATLLAKFVQIGVEARKIRKLADETRKALNAPLELSSQEQSATSNYDILANKEGKYTLDQQKGALVKLNSLLGTEYEWTSNIADKLDEINAKKARYIAYIRAQQGLERAQAKLTEATTAFDEWKQENTNWKEHVGRRLPSGWGTEGNLTPDAQKIQDFQSNISVASNAVQQWSETLAKYSAEFEGAPVTSSTTTGGGGGFIDEESPLAKAQKSYTEALGELTAQAQAGLITDRELERKKRDAIEKAYIEAVSSGDGGVLGSSWFKELEQSFGSFAHGDLRKRQEDAEDMLAEYTEGLRELMRQNEAGALSAEEYRDAVRELATAFYREAGALDLSKLPQWLASEIGIARVGAQVTSRSNATPYTPLKKNHRTWEMSDVDIAAEKLAEQENYLRYLQDTAKSVAGDMTAEINAQLAKVDSLEKALQLEEAKEAVEELSRSINQAGWDGIKNAVSNLDNIVSAAERVADVMSDTDASGWERIMAIWELMTSMIDGFMEIITMINTMREMTERLTAAKEVQSQIENAATQQKVANTSVEMAASAAQASQEVADAGTVIGARTSEAIATGTAQGAKAGWPALLWAIPAVLATIMAGLAMMPKFAKGGVVGGNSKHGDKVLARLNSGEGVLTEQGMANLAGLAGAKATNVNVTGRLKAHGRDLVVVLEQEKRFQRRIG